MKKFLKTIIACFVIIPCFFILFGCNDPQNPNPTNLTKAQYAQAFESVEKTLTTSTNNQVKLANAGYVETENPNDASVGLITFIKLIMENDTFVLTNDTIEYTVIVPDGYSTSATLRQKITFDGSNITGFMAIGMPSFTDNSGGEQAILFTINYNFDTNTLESYKLDSYAYFPGFGEGQQEMFCSTILEDGKFLTLDNADENYETITAGISSQYTQFKSINPTVKNYNFNAEFAKAHGME